MGNYSSTIFKGTNPWDSADAISQDKPRGISTDIRIYHPNRNQFLGYVLSRVAKESRPISHGWGHNEQVASRNYVKFLGDTETSQGATGLVFGAQASGVIGLGSRIYFPRTDQIIYLTAAMASATTTGAVSRNFGKGSVTDYLQTNEQGLVLPPAHIEGFTTPAGYAHGVVNKGFDMTETAYPIDTTFVANAETHFSGNPFNRALSDTMVQFKDQMEFESIWSGKVYDASTYTHPVRATQGIDTWITTNVFTADSPSRMDLWDIIGIWKGFYMQPGGIIVTSTQIRTIISEWAMSSSDVVVPITGQGGEGELGITVKRINTVQGTFDILTVDAMSQDPFLAGTMYFMPDPATHMAYRFLQGEDIRFRPLEEGKVHSKFGELYGIYGWEFWNEFEWAKLSGWNVAA